MFGRWYETLLDSAETPVKCYLLVVNSLRRFFITNTFGNAVEVWTFESNWKRFLLLILSIQTMVGDFLKTHVIRSCADLNRQYESGATTDGERRLRETQLQVLLEMYASHLDPTGPSRVPEVSACFYSSSPFHVIR